MKTLTVMLSAVFLLQTNLFANDMIKAYSVINGDTIDITLQNNTPEYVFVSDPNYFGVTVITKNGGRMLGNQPFDMKDTKLIVLYPKKNEGSNLLSSFKFSFKQDAVKSINVNHKKVVVWACRLSKVTRDQRIDLDRVEILLDEPPKSEETQITPK